MISHHDTERDLDPEGSLFDFEAYFAEDGVHNGQQDPSCRELSNFQFITSSTRAIQNIPTGIDTLRRTFLVVNAVPTSETKLPNNLPTNHRQQDPEREKNRSSNPGLLNAATCVSSSTLVSCFSTYLLRPSWCWGGSCGAVTFTFLETFWSLMTVLWFFPCRLNCIIIGINVS